MLRGQRVDSRIRDLERELAAAHDELAQAQIQRSRLAGALAASSDAVVVVDADGVEVFRNARAQRYRKPRGADSVIAKAIAELAQRARAGEPTEREIELHGPPPQTVYLSGVTVHDGVKAAGAVVFVRDMSQTRRVDQLRRDFVANVSHELKTPIGALGLLSETMSDVDDPVVARRLAERVASEAQRLGRLVDDLLELAVLEARGDVPREPVELSDVVADARERVVLAAEAAAVDLVLQAGTGTALLERSRIVSALANLLQNAIAASSPGGSVTLDARIDGTTLTITVVDTGVGIPARHLERIFERFYRVDRARTRATGGTGLGLAIVRHAVASHGGEVTVESVEGEGSTFTVQLPTGTTDDTNEVI